LRLDPVIEKSDFTGVVKCRIEASGLTVFDKPCAADEPFPWPAQRISGPMDASVYLVPGAQPLATDGPYTVTIGTKFLNPALTVEPAHSGDHTRRFTLALSDGGFVPPPFSDLGYTVTCSQDGGHARPCLDTGVTTLLRTPGGHVLHVLVTAPDGAHTGARLEWRVPIPPVTLHVSRPDRTRPAGSHAMIVARGLLPRERFAIPIAGTRVAHGTADDRGRVRDRVMVPRRLRPGRVEVVVVGATKHRRGHRHLRVVAAVSSHPLSRALGIMAT
jgi:hypothetical protein